LPQPLPGRGGLGIGLAGLVLGEAGFGFGIGRGFPQLPHPVTELWD